MDHNLNQTPAPPLPIGKDHESAAKISGSLIVAASADGLALYDNACRALAEAKAVDEVQDIRAKAEAMRAYSKQAKNRQMELDAVEIRIRAERRIGELMEAQAETVGKAAGQLRRGLESNPREADDPPTLAEAGIDKNLAHRARTYAAVPAETFERLLTNKRKRDSVRVVLDPEFQAEAEASARDLEIERDERISMGGDPAAELAAENENLKKQIAALDRRIAALVEENGSLKARANVWQQRAVDAGWTKGRTDA